MDTFPASGPVKGEIIGKKRREKRCYGPCSTDMNFELTDNIQSTDQNMKECYGCSFICNGFKKVYVDAALDRQVSMYVPLKI